MPDLRENQERVYTFRAFFVGVLFCILVALAAQYSVNIVHGSYLAIDHMPAGAIFLFFIFVILINSILRKISLKLGFRSGELLLIYVMMLVASTVVTMGLGTQILPILTGPYYYATPQNRWAEIIQPHIKSWLVPQDKEVIRTFYEGLSKGQTIPWGAWIKPLSAWLPFLLALYFVMICIMVILRKQWMERERLIYPLVRLPLEMVKENPGYRGAILPLFKNRLMWLGFAIPFIIGSINALHAYYNFIPRITLSNFIPVFRGTHRMFFRLSFPILGFSYLINLDVAFSLWFFNLLFTVIKGMFKMVGIASTENVGIYGSGGDAIFFHVGMGAFIVLVVWGLWIARSHLKDVFRKAFTSSPEVDDSDEILSYRVAVWGVIIGFLFMTVWLTLTGIPWWVSVLFLLVALFLFMGLTRIVAESGVATLVAPAISSSAIVSALGTGPIGQSGLVGLSFTYVYSADIRTFVMNASAHGMKIAQRMGKRNRPLFWAMMIAVIVGMGTAIYTSLRLAYLYGGINLNSWYFGGNPRAPFNYAADKILHPHGPNILGWFTTGIGAAVMFALMVLRQRFIWWPLHPIGFTIGAVWLMDQLWLSIFLAWLIKGTILRYGGAKLYNRIIPFFLGLILGQYSAAGFWFVVDLFTGKTGNAVFWI